MMLMGHKKLSKKILKSNFKINKKEQNNDPHLAVNNE